MSAPARHLRPVGDFDPETGEIPPGSRIPELLAQIEKLQGDLKAAERDLRAKRRQIAELERNKEQERREHPDRELIVRIATYWHKRCRGGDKRINPLSPARFDAVAGLVEMTVIEVDEETKKRRRVRRYQPEDFKTAIDGAHFDHFVKKRKNGSERHFDDLEWICRDSKQFEECIASAPGAPS